jgi:NADH:ubiquinone oxidoreductase subunit C
MIGARGEDAAPTDHRAVGAASLPRRLPGPQPAPIAARRRSHRPARAVGAASLPRRLPEPLPASIAARRRSHRPPPRGSGIPAATTSRATASTRRGETPLPQNTALWERHPCRDDFQSQRQHPSRRDAAPTHQRAPWERHPCRDDFQGHSQHPSRRDAAPTDHGAPWERHPCRDDFQGLSQHPSRRDDFQSHSPSIHPGETPLPQNTAPWERHPWRDDFQGRSQRPSRRDAAPTERRAVGAASLPRRLPEPLPASIAARTPLPQTTAPWERHPCRDDFQGSANTRRGETPLPQANAPWERHPCRDDFHGLSQYPSRRDAAPTVDSTE